MRFLRLAALAPLLALAACDGAESSSGPRWIDLSEHFQPRPIEELVQRLEAKVEPPRAGHVVQRASGAAPGAKPETKTEPWFELPLAREAWKPGKAPHEWRTPLPRGGALPLCEPDSLVLVAGDKHWEKSIRRTLASNHYADRFAVDGAELVLYLPNDSDPPELLRARLTTRGQVDGHARAILGDFTCNGFLVFPGEPETVRCEIPAASRLCVTTVAPLPDAAGSGPTTFRVKLDGRTLLEHVAAAPGANRGEWHSLALDSSGKHELAFEVDGPGPAVFAAPIVAPVESASAPKRSAPDVVLLILDTFRADNLAAWGGAPERAPKLDAFVERSLRFVDARATAAWTLPSIGTLMSGLYPGQHGGTDFDRKVAAEADTLAEVLARQGYRTAAITDAGLFSRTYGQDQGFEWFEEIVNSSWPERTSVSNWSLEKTLAKARERLSADDGRPLFLVVHTYRVHDPLRVGASEDGRPWQAEAKRLEQAGTKAKDLAYMQAAHGFYLQAVADVDAKVGAWLAELDSARFFEHGNLVLTADHGHSFGEHDQMGHGSDLFDVKLRVPLAIAGRGIEPRAAPGIVSLIDLPPTIAALAGVAPSPTWPGRSLLAGAAPRPSYAFDLRKSFSQVALFEGQRKLMAGDAGALREGKLLHAFDVGADPGEERDLAASGDWPTTMARELARNLEPLLVPASKDQTFELPPEKADELRGIGY